MRVLVLAWFVAYAVAKPTISEIPLNSYGVPVTQGASFEYSSGGSLLNSVPSLQNVQITKQSSYGLSQPEISNVGSYGLGLSSTTASPLLLNSVVPSSTVSSLFTDGASNINLGGVSNANLLLNSPSVSSGYDFSSSVSPSVSTVVSQNVPDVQVAFTGLNQNLLQPSVTQNLVAPSFEYKQSVSSVPSFQSVSSLPTYQSVSSFPSTFQNQYTTQNRNSYYESNYQYNSSQAPIVSKHLYYFEAPQDYEEVRARKVVQVAPPQKTYKIIFIKAPSAPELGPIDIPVQSQNEEKTVVYVLSKKPETEQQVRVHSSSTLKQSKPEVFFIKYNTKEEAEKAILDAQNGLGGGAVGSAYGDASQLVSSITQQELRSQQNKQLRQQEFAAQLQNEQVLNQNQGFSSNLRFGESSTALPLLQSSIAPIVQYNTPLTQTVKTVKIESNGVPSTSGNVLNYQSSLPVSSFSGVNFVKNVESSTALPLASGSFLSSNLNQFQSQTPSISGNYQVKYGSSYTPINTVYKTTRYESAVPSTFNTGSGSSVFSASSNLTPLKVNTEYLPSFGSSFNLVSSGRSREEQSEEANILDNKNTNEEVQVGGSDDKKFTTLFGNNLSQVSTLSASEDSETVKNEAASTTLKTL